MFNSIKCFTAAKLVGPGPTRPTPGYATDNHYTILSISPSCRNLNDVEDMMEDIQEQNEIAEEFTKIVTQPIGVQDFDEVSLNECPHHIYT